MTAADPDPEWLDAVEQTVSECLADQLARKHWLVNGRVVVSVALGAARHRCRRSRPRG